MGVLGHPEDVQSPFIDVFQILLDRSENVERYVSVSASQTPRIAEYLRFIFDRLPSTAVPPDLS